MVMVHFNRTQTIRLVLLETNLKKTVTNESNGAVRREFAKKCYGCEGNFLCLALSSS